MNAVFKRDGNRRGQALIETLLVLPLLVLFIVWSLQFFQAIHASHIQQKVVRFYLAQKLDNRADFSQRPSLAIRFKGEEEAYPSYKVGTKTSVIGLPGSGTGKIFIRTHLGLCQEMRCQ